MPRVDLIQLRGGTAAAWTSTNPVLAPREEGIETDTGLRKVGDGVTDWISLPYNGGGDVAAVASDLAALESLIPDTYVTKASDETLTGEKTLQQEAGNTPLRIHSTEPQSGEKLLEILGPSRSGGAERYTFMVDHGGNVRMNTALTISGGTSDAGNIPPEPIPGASYAIGILNDIAPGGGGMDRDAGILSVLGIPGQIHMRCFDSSEQLQFEIGPTGALKIQLWEPSAVGLHIRGSFGQTGKLLRLRNSDEQEMLGVSPTGAVSAAGTVTSGGNLSTSLAGTPRINFTGGSFGSGMGCETAGIPNDIVNFGINDTRVGVQDAAVQGGFLRFDARTGSPVGGYYVRPASGSLALLLSLWADRNMGINLPGSDEAGFGSGAGVLGIANCTVVPSTNSPYGGTLFADAGAGKWRGSSGTVTTFGPAEPHCSDCGRDFALEWENERFGYLALCMWCITEEMTKGVMARVAA